MHGESALLAARRITDSLFSGDLASLTENDLAQLAQDGLPCVALARNTDGLIDALAATGLAKSKSEARTFIQGGSVSINGHKVDALEHRIDAAERLYDRYTCCAGARSNTRWWRGSNTGALYRLTRRSRSRQRPLIPFSHTPSWTSSSIRKSGSLFHPDRAGTGTGYRQHHLHLDRCRQAA